MQEVTITVVKSTVMNEVAKASEYVGMKMLAQDDAYQRISLVDQNRELLERFWVEACSLATDTLRPWLIDVGEQPIHQVADITTDYEATLSLSDRYDSNLTDSVQAALLSYFVASILGKWFRISNKEEAEAYATEAAAILQTVEQKLYHKKEPTRLTS